MEDVWELWVTIGNQSLSGTASRAFPQFKQMHCIVDLCVLKDWGLKLDETAMVKQRLGWGRRGPRVQKGQVQCDKENNWKELTAKLLES